MNRAELEEFVCEHVGQAGDGRELLRALQKAGLVIVPREPTKAMEDAADNVVQYSDYWLANREAWKLMIDAAWS